VVCREFSHICTELRLLRFALNLNMKNTRNFISYDDALLRHLRGPLCCKQVGKEGERKGTGRLRRQMGIFTGHYVCCFDFVVLCHRAAGRARVRKYNVPYTAVR